jgi:parallel beta-helix repeat protein
MNFAWRLYGNWAIHSKESLVSAMNKSLRRTSALMVCAVLFGVLAVVTQALPAQAATQCVSPTGAGGCFTTIQAAVTAAAPGDTIPVAAGMYTEQLVIGKSLTLVGSGAATSIIQAPGVLASDPDGTKTVVLFTGPITAEFSGFTVQGPVNGLNFGVYVRAGAAGNIHDNVIRDIRDQPLSSGQNGVAIEVGKYPDTAPVVSETGTATITNNTIYGYQKTGIAVEKTGSSATITGNTITGAGPITTTAQNGIQIRRGATGTVRTNTVTGNAYDGPTYSAIGIGAMRAGSGVIIQGNTVNHNSANIYSWNSDSLQVLDNQVSDSSPVDQNAVAGITIQADGLPDPYGGAAGPYLTGVTISGNTIQNNLSGGSSQGDGIDLYTVNGATISGNTIAGASRDGILIGNSGGIAIANNHFSNNGNGLAPADATAAAIDFRGPPSEDWSLPGGNGGPNPLGGFTAHGNTFVGNRNGIRNYDSGNVNATSNWWGNASGPGALTNVTTVPWCTSSNCSTVSSNADLISLSLSDGTLSPVFSSSITSYTASVANRVTSVAVTKTSSPGAGAVVSGGASLVDGDNIVTIAVTSADGTARKTYTVTVTRTPAATEAAVAAAAQVFAEAMAEARARAAAQAATEAAAQAAAAAAAEAASRTVVLPPGTTTIDASTKVSMVTGRDTILTDRGKLPVAGFTLPAVTIPNGTTQGGTTTTVALMVDLTKPQDVGGGITVTVEKSVIVASSIAGQPITLTQTAVPDVSVNITDGTAVLAPTGWDGKINPPSVGTSAGTPPSGFTVGRKVVEVGSSTVVLLFDHPASVVLTGVTGPVGYRPSGSTTWVPISPCGPVGPIFPGACSQTDGTNTTILTFHFTAFAALTVVPAVTALPETPVAATPVAKTAKMTVVISGSGAYRSIKATLGALYANKRATIEMRRYGSKTFNKLAVVTLNKAGTVVTKRYLYATSTIRVVVNGKVLVTTAFRR